MSLNVCTRKDVEMSFEMKALNSNPAEHKSTIFLQSNTQRVLKMGTAQSTDN